MFEQEWTEEQLAEFAAQNAQYGIEEPENVNYDGWDGIHSPGANFEGTPGHKGRRELFAGGFSPNGVRAPFSRPRNALGTGSSIFQDSPAAKDAEERARQAAIFKRNNINKKRNIKDNVYANSSDDSGSSDDSEDGEAIIISPRGLNFSPHDSSSKSVSLKEAFHTEKQHSQKPLTLQQNTSLKVPTEYHSSDEEVVVDSNDPHYHSQSTQNNSSNNRSNSTAKSPPVVSGVKQKADMINQQEKARPAAVLTRGLSAQDKEAMFASSRGSAAAPKLGDQPQKSPKEYREMQADVQQFITASEKKRRQDKNTAHNSNNSSGFDGEGEEEERPYGKDYKEDSPVRTSHKGAKDTLSPQNKQSHSDDVRKTALMNHSLNTTHRDPYGHPIDSDQEEAEEGSQSEGEQDQFDRLQIHTGYGSDGSLLNSGESPHIMLHSINNSTKANESYTPHSSSSTAFGTGQPKGPKTTLDITDDRDYDYSTYNDTLLYDDELISQNMRSSNNNNTNSSSSAQNSYYIRPSADSQKEESSSVNSRDSTSNIHTSAFNAAIKTKPYPKNSYSAG
eukprot:gene30437-37651_t